MKRARIAVLVVVFVLSIATAFGQFAVADSSTKIYGDKIECNSGDVVNFSVNISGNPGITGFVIGAVSENDWLYFDDTVLSALGHDVVIDPAVEPTYTSTGLTEGSHCARCNEVLVKQIVIPILVREELRRYA